MICGERSVRPRPTCGSRPAEGWRLEQPAGMPKTELALVVAVLFLDKRRRESQPLPAFGPVVGVQHLAGEARVHAHVAGRQESGFRQVHDRAADDDVVVAIAIDVATAGQRAAEGDVAGSLEVVEQGARRAEKTLA